MMASQDVFVGIDVSKDRLDVHVRPLGGGFSVWSTAGERKRTLAASRDDPDSAEMAARYGAGTKSPIFSEQLVCSRPGWPGG
jgi:hypothetical protein